MPDNEKQQEQAKQEAQYLEYVNQELANKKAFVDKYGEAAVIAFSIDQATNRIANCLNPIAHAHYKMIEANQKLEESSGIIRAR